MKIERKAERKRLERHYSLKETGALLGVAPSTVKGWIRQGHLPRVKMPGLRGKVLLRESDLVGFLDAHREDDLAGVVGRVYSELVFGARTSTKS